MYVCPCCLEPLIEVDQNDMGTFEDEGRIYDGKGWSIKKTGVESIDNARRKPGVLAGIKGATCATTPGCGCG